MPRVDAIRAGRTRPDLRVVIVDGGGRFRLDAETLAGLGLEVGDEVSPDLLAHLGARDEAERAREAALRLLDLRLRAEGELRERLGRRGFAGEAIDAVVGDLRAAGAIDDLRFARAWIEGRRLVHPTGRARLAWELRRKRVPAGVIETALRGVGAGDELEAARQAARRRLSALRGLDREVQRRRLGTFLQRRGFAGATVVAVLREMLGRRAGRDGSGWRRRSKIAKRTRSAANENIGRGRFEPER